MVSWKTVRFALLAGSMYLAQGLSCITDLLNLLGLGGTTAT